MFTEGVANSKVKKASALPFMSSVAAGGRKLLKVVGIDFEVKLPPTDATKEDRRLVCGISG